MTLVSVLIASALIGMLAVILATLFGTMAGYMNRSTTQTDIDQAVSYIYGILADRNLCNNALRTGGAKVNWNFASTPSRDVGEIRVDPNGTGGTIAIQTPKTFSPSLKLLSMSLREPDISKGEAGKVRTKIVKSGKTYDSISARLVLNFETPKNMPGGVLRERYINLTLGIDASTHDIEFCYPQADTSLQEFTCDLATLNSQTAPYNRPDCPDPAASPSTTYCTKLYYVSEFSDVGKPICSCQLVCPPTVNVYTPPGGGGSYAPGPSGY